MARPRVLKRILGMLLFIFAAAFLVPELRVDNSLERWLPSDSPAIQNYRRFLSEFGSDALLILIVPNRGSAQPEKSLAKDLESLGELDYVLGTGSWPSRYVEHKLPVDSDHQTYIIRFRPESHANPNRPELLDRIDDIMQGRNTDYYLAGTGVISRAINAQTARDASRFLLIGLLVLILFLSILIRDLIAIAQTLLVALGAIASVIFVSVVGGIAMSMAHTVVPVIILFYSTSISMHILSHGGDFRKIFKPSIWVLATTILGFSAFLPSGIPLLRDFALLGMAGITGVFAASLWIFYPQVYHFQGNFLISRTRSIARVKKSWLPLGILGLCLVSAQGMWQLRSEIYSLSILDSSSKAYRDHFKAEEIVGPYFPLEYVVDTEEISRTQLSRWVREVYKIPEVGAVASFHRFPPLQDLQAIGYRSRGHPTQHRVTFFVPLLSTTQGRVLTQRIEAVGQGFFESGGPQLTGFMTLYANVSEVLLRAFRSSLLIGLLVVSLMMALYLRRWKFFLPAMLVNVLPVMVMLGVMGWLGIRLDMVTIPVGCLLLSIVVDDTIHFMHWFRKNRDEDEALRESGPGIIMTSVVLSAGFAILLLSGAPPVRYFGLLSITAVGIALACDLYVLPWLLRKMVQR